MAHALVAFVRPLEWFVFSQHDRLLGRGWPLSPMATSPVRFDPLAIGECLLYIGRMEKSRFFGPAKGAGPQNDDIRCRSASC